MSKTYTFFADPSHGWLKVDRQELIDLGIDKQITEYSYQFKSHVYLEEDGDLNTFLKAKGFKTLQGADCFKYKEVNTDQDSFIRAYDHYQPL